MLERQIEIKNMTTLQWVKYKSTQFVMIGLKYLGIVFYYVFIATAKFAWWTLKQLWVPIQWYKAKLLRIQNKEIDEKNEKKLNQKLYSKDIV